MTVSSAQVYATLRRAIGPTLKVAAFERVKGGRLVWSRPLGHQTVAIHFVVSPSGWTAAYGSQFTLGFELLDEASAHENRQPRDFASLLSPKELEMVRNRNNLVARSLPGPRPGDPLLSLAPNALDRLSRSNSPRRQPYLSGQEVWMRYYSLDGVSSWAHLREPRISALSKAYEASVREDGS